MLSACDRFFALVALTLRSMSRAQHARIATLLEHRLLRWRIEYYAGARTDQYLCLRGLCSELASALATHGGHQAALVRASEAVAAALAACMVLRVSSPSSAGYGHMSGLSVFWPTLVDAVGHQRYSSASEHSDVWTRTGVAERMPSLVQARSHFMDIAQRITDAKRQEIALEQERVRRRRESRRAAGGRRWGNSRLRL